MKVRFELTRRSLHGWKRNLLPCQATPHSMEVCHATVAKLMTIGLLKARACLYVYQFFLLRSRKALSLSTSSGALVRDTSLDSCPTRSVGGQTYVKIGAARWRRSTKGSQCSSLLSSYVPSEQKTKDSSSASATTTFFPLFASALTHSVSIPRMYPHIASGMGNAIQSRKS